jgi:hypothetical protein
MIPTTSLLDKKLLENVTSLLKRKQTKNIQVKIFTMAHTLGRLAQDTGI